MNIVIKEPCHAKWDEMSPSEQGRFCSACSKEVVDFSKKTKLQTLIYLDQHEDVCGRVPSSYLLNTSIKLDLEELAMSKLKPLHKFAFLCFLAFGLSLFSCDTNNNEIVGEISVSAQQQFSSPLPQTFFESLQKEKGKGKGDKKKNIEINSNKSLYYLNIDNILITTGSMAPISYTGLTVMKDITGNVVHPMDKCQANIPKKSKIDWARMYKWTEEEWSRFNQRELRLTALKNKLFPSEDLLL